ncbi:MAG TPA: hypothetical protein VNO52_12360 [Methylomirabilota bacterium]|nr:hypothetical protein [Methylomirabilota bacterium]
MPPPAYRQLSYAVTGEGDRTHTDLMLVTNVAACARVAFVNYLTYGINPGWQVGYGDFLALATVSSNTLPLIRTVHHSIVESVEEIEGGLFPLRVGNTLRFRVTRRIELRDAAGRSLQRYAESATFEYQVQARQEGYAASQPPVAGDIFVIAQTVRGPAGEVQRKLSFSPELGACVRQVTLRDHQPAAEARLTRWW